MGVIIMIRTGFEDFTATYNHEPSWMKDERYGYCEDFYELCEENNNKFVKELSKIPMILLTMIFR